MIRLKTEKDIELLRDSGKILVQILLALKERSKKGTNLLALEETARAMLREAGAVSAFLNYKPEESSKPYPAVLCTSLNEQIVHGIPYDYELKEGDVLKLDFGVVYRDRITDAAITVPIGNVPKGTEKLIHATRESLDKGIAAATIKDARLGDIGWAIAHHIENQGLSIVDGLTGHGVGFKLHEDPSVFNYGTKGEGMLLKEGLVLAIEPMVSMGSSRTVSRKDGSYETKDGSVSAHFEKTIAITNNGVEILTAF